jgi:uncharacterized protein YciI
MEIREKNMIRSRFIALLTVTCACLLYSFALLGNTSSKISKVKEENKMFVILVKYKKSPEEVKDKLQPHIDFLKKHYESSDFIVSGPRNPWNGGVILANGDSLDQVWSLVKEDPFFAQGIVEYEVIEFIPTMYDERFACFLK